MGDSTTIFTSPDGVLWTDRSFITNYNLPDNEPRLVFIYEDGRWVERLYRDNNYLSSVAYGKNQCVVVGRNGMIFSSPDGTRWTKGSYVTANSLESIAYGNNQFIAVGRDGVIVTSPNGITWTQQSSGTVYELYGITYGNNQFVVVGRFGTILTSPDGVTWTIIRFEYSYELRSVVFGNKEFVAVGRKGVIITSLDGITWTDRSSEAINCDLNSVGFGNNQFIAVGMRGTIITSPDGTKWTGHAALTEKRLESITYGNNQFIAVGENSAIIALKDDNTLKKLENRYVNKSIKPITISPVQKNLIIQELCAKHIGKNMRISLYDVAGKRIYTSKIAIIRNTVTIPLHAILQGIYCVEIHSGKCVEYYGSIAITQ